MPKTTTIHVSLDESTTPPQLHLEHYGHAHIDKDTAAQTITWKLKGKLTKSEFTTNSFSWRSPPKHGIFDTPVPNSSNKTLSMTDTHLNAGSDGDFPYQLSVEFDGTTYTCPPKQPAPPPGTDLLLRDPVIINR